MQTTERVVREKLNLLIIVKKTLFGYNYLVWAAGCAAACLGIWFRVERDFTTLIQRIEEADISMSSASIYIGANLLISIGSIIAFVGLFGAIGVIKEKEIMLIIYAILLFCTFGIYAGCAGWGFHRLDFLKGIVSDSMRELFNKALIEHTGSAKYAVNEIQRQLQCCGNVGPSEYAGDIPPSCSSYVIGCNQAFYDFFRRNTLVLSITAIVFGFLQLFAIGLAVYFAYEVRIARKIVEESTDSPDGTDQKLLNSS